MRRNELWKRISYISLSGILAISTAASSVSMIAAEDSAVTVEVAEEGANPPAAEEAVPVEQEIPAEPEPPVQIESEPVVPSEEVPTEPQTSAPTEPMTEAQTPASTEGVQTEPATEAAAQTPVTEQPQTEPAGNPQTEETTASTETEKESETETESETDFSEMNANYATNIIYSNAGYLGQLSSAYGISISEGFAQAVNEAEAQLRSHITDAEDFRVTNWRDVFAVFLYESKRSKAGGQLSGDSKELLTDILMKMNAPVEALGLVGEAPEFGDIFVEEYPIEEELEKIAVREELLTQAFSDMPGITAQRAEDIIEAEARQQREAQKELRKQEMDKARYEKWLRSLDEYAQKAARQSEQFSVKEMSARTISDYVELFGLDEEAKSQMERYGSAECMQLCAIASASRQVVRASLGNDISEQRVGIVTAAYSLVGKVGYFWGGKSYAIGWDPNWGTQQQVWAEGSQSSGMIRSYGLDCSGFTMYCYINGLGGSDAGIGGHTTSQWNASVMVDQSTARAGDLVFYGGPERGDMNHVGVVVGKSSDGGLIVAHCSSAVNGVIVGEAWSSGFRYVRSVPGLA